VRHAGHGREDREEKGEMGKGLTRGPHLAARQGDGYEVDGLRWAERKGRPAVRAGGDTVDFNISVKAQAGKGDFLFSYNLHPYLNTIQI
jgi:hypothetical protein